MNTLNIGRIPDRWRRNEDGGTTVEIGNPEFSGVREITISFDKDGVGRLGGTALAGGITVEACVAGPSPAVEQLVAIANSALGTAITQLELSSAIAVAVYGAKDAGTPTAAGILTEKGPEIVEGFRHAGCIYVHFHDLDADRDRVVLLRVNQANGSAVNNPMLRIDEFTAGEPDGDGDLSPNIRFTVTNTTTETVRMVAYRVVFGDAPGHPLRYEGTYYEPCNLPPGDSIDLRANTYINVEAESLVGGAFSAAIAVGLLVREFINVGEVEIPLDDRGSATLERQVQSKVLEGPLKVRVSRSRTDGDGMVRAECAVLVCNALPEKLGRVELKCELVDGDGAVVGDEVTVTEMDAGAVGCVNGGTMWTKPAALRDARLRLMLSVFRPIEWAEVACASEPLGLSADDDESDESSVEDEAPVDDDDGELEDEGALSKDLGESDDDGDSEDDEGDEENDDGKPDGGNEGLDDAVLTVLAKAGATEFIEAFEEHQITADMLGDLTSEDLESMGVAALGMRKRILQAIADSGLTAPPPAPQRAGAEAADEPDWDALISSLRPRFQEHTSVMLAPDPGHKKVVGALSYAGRIAPGTKVLLAYDDTMFGSGKDGMLVTSEGVHWKNQFADTGFQAWGSLRKATPKGKSVEIDPGGKIQINWGGAKCAEVLATFINACAGIASINGSDEHSQREDLRDALAEMRETEEDGFVVVEEPSAGSLIVQFCNGDCGPIMEVPLDAFERYRRERAAAFLGQLQFAETAVGSSKVLVREFAEDELDLLTSIAVRAVQGIHGLPSRTRLRIVRGWE